MASDDKPHVLQQILDTRRVPLPDGRKHWGDAVFVRRVYLCSLKIETRVFDLSCYQLHVTHLGDQELGYLELSVVSGVVQGQAPVNISIDIVLIIAMHTTIVIALNIATII